MYQPSLLRRLWWKYRSLRLPWRRKILAGHDLDGNLFFSLGKRQSSGRERRMVKFRVKDDWASYKLPPQWQTWLRHGREDPPSIQELIADETRRHRTRELAARIDKQWRQLPSQGGAERLPIEDTDEALRAFNTREVGPAEVLKNLPGKDPGAQFEPSTWEATIQVRTNGEQQTPKTCAVDEESVPINPISRTDPSSAKEGSKRGELTGKVGHR